MVTSKKFLAVLLVIIGTNQVQVNSMAAPTTNIERFKNFSKNAALTVYNKAIQHKGKITVVGATAAVAAAAVYKREALLACATSSLEFGRTQMATLWSKMPSLRKAAVVADAEQFPTFGQWIASLLGETKFVKDGGLYGLAKRAFASSDVVGQPEVLSRTQKAMAFLANGARPFNWLKKISKSYLRRFSLLSPRRIAIVTVGSFGLSPRRIAIVTVGSFGTGAGIAFVEDKLQQRQQAKLINQALLQAIPVQAPEQPGNE